MMMMMMIIMMMMRRKKIEEKTFSRLYSIIILFRTKSKINQHKLSSLLND
jgi:hypothetical protein